MSAVDIARPLTGYEPGTVYDEAFSAPGVPRPHYASALDRLLGYDLEAVRVDVQADVDASGCGFRVAGGSNAFVVDPVPRIIEAAEWWSLSAGIEQRVRALDAFVRDVYDRRAIVSAGVVPARVIDSADHHEPGVAAHRRPFQIGMAGLDVIRDADGRFLVLEDNVRTPSGYAYMIAARRATAERYGVDGDLADVESAVVEALRETLRAAAPPGVEDPVVAVLSDGAGSSAWWEHQELARLTGARLLLTGECEVHHAHLCWRDEQARLHPVDVVYRRTDEDRLRDDDGRPTAVGELLDEPLRAGTVTCVNAFGTGVADDKLVHAYVEDMIRFYLGEEPLLRSVTTYDLEDPACLREALGRLGELVVKPRTGHGGHGVVIGPRATRDELRDAAAAISGSPGDWIAQETICFSRHPTVIDGRLRPRHVDLRPFVLFDGKRARALPGGLTRVAFEEGELVVNSSQDGGAKDTWVLR
jgi:carboxylate-amine ligase